MLVPVGSCACAGQLFREARRAGGQTSPDGPGRERQLGLAGKASKSRTRANMIYELSDMVYSLASCLDSFTSRASQAKLFNLVFCQLSDEKK